MMALNSKEEVEKVFIDPKWKYFKQLRKNIEKVNEN